MDILAAEVVDDNAFVGATSAQEDEDLEHTPEALGVRGPSKHHERAAAGEEDREAAQVGIYVRLVDARLVLRMGTRHRESVLKQRLAAQRATVIESAYEPNGNILVRLMARPRRTDGTTPLTQRLVLGGAVVLPRAATSGEQTRDTGSNQGGGAGSLISGAYAERRTYCVTKQSTSP